MVSNNNVTFVLLELILAYAMADLSPGSGF